MYFEYTLIRYKKKNNKETHLLYYIKFKFKLF